jgi:hypothetical protein
MQINRTRAGVAAIAVAATLGLAACSGGGSTASSGGGSSSSAATAASGGLDLSGVCPATVVIQTDWNPEADHGHLYQLLGPNPEVDAAKKTATADLVVGGKSTGVKVQVRSGGPAIGFQPVTQQMYTDSSITLGYVSSDEALQNSAKFPTKAVFAQNLKSPQIVMWDPKTYPQVTDIKTLSAALEKSGGVIRYFKGAAYMDYLKGAGIVSEKVLDGSYDGSPAKFVGSGGKDAQQGFATAEPYVYQNEVGAWKKPVKYQLVYDTGYPIYPEAVSIRTGDESKLAPCLKKLVPVLQQANVDYVKSPEATNKVIVDLVTKYNNGWVYGEGVAAFGAKQLTDLGLVGDGPSGYAGEMEEARFQKVIDIDTPIFTKGGTAPKSGIKATDLFTNEYLSKTIKFG